MNRIWITIVFLCALVVTNISAVTLREDGVVECTNEDYAIFSAALDYLYGGKKLKALLLSELTSTGVPPGIVAVTNLRGTIQGFYDRIPEDSRQDFDARNKNRAKVKAGNFRVSVEINVIQDEDNEAFNARGGWKTFYKEYPTIHGIWVISLPGLNRTHDRALLYVGHACGPMCGGGTVLVLSNTSGKWTVIDTETLWRT